jgi:hypothetical protein
MNLKRVLGRVSKNCLRGQPVPADLQALWKAQLAGAADLLERVELTLVDRLDEEFFEGYREEDGVPPASVRAHCRMFEQIAFFARTMDGGLLGYWLGEQNRPVAEAPVVELDSEGQYELKGTNVAEYLLLWTDMDEPEEFAEFRQWLAGHGITTDVKNHKAIWKKLKPFGDPNALSWRYQREEAAHKE